MSRAIHLLAGQVREHARRYGELAALAERETWAYTHHGAKGMLAAAWADFDAALCELEAAVLEQAPPGTITLLPMRYGARP
jgi:hypothetical protein